MRWLKVKTCADIDGRILVLVGATIQVGGQYTMGGLGLIKNPSRAVKSGIIAGMVISAHGYSLGWAPVSHTLSAELPNTKVRDMTYRTASVLNIATQ
jgi:MFS transporter, SP family, sugar:H+ symporter